jgi:hypothetical protein
MQRKINASQQRGSNHRSDDPSKMIDPAENKSAPPPPPLPRRRSLRCLAAAKQEATEFVGRRSRDVCSEACLSIPSVTPLSKP